MLSKPLEKHVHNHLLNHLERNKLLSPTQSGFRPKHSCQTALTKMCENWLSAINNSEMVGAVFLDFKKAFDTVNHSILINKLELYTGDETSTYFFKSYLTNRQQYVSVNGEQSMGGTIISGVPQGSILGPLLFCIFINDLPLIVSAKDSSTNKQSIVTNDLFADDASLYSSNNNPSIIEASLQNSLNITSQWCKNNRMVIHPDKTKCMMITTRQKHQKNASSLNLFINDSQIQQVDRHRVLGVTLDKEFKWLPHLENVLKHVSRNLYLFSRVKHFADQESMLLFFYGHFLPSINYASNLWDSCADLHIKKLNACHRRAIKIIHSGKDLSTDEKFKQLGVLTLEKQLQLNKAVFMYKTVNNLAPEYLDIYVKKATFRYGSTNLIIPPTRIDLYKSSLSFSGSLLWNSIPKHIRNKSTVSGFKTCFKKYLLSS